MTIKYQASLFVVILSLAAAMSIGSCGGDELHSGLTGSMLRGVLHHDGAEREYFVHVPAGNGSPTNNLPVVVALHGYSATATGFQAAHGLNLHATQNGYIVVYPQGSHFNVDSAEGNSTLITSWNDLAINQSQKPEGPHCADPQHDYPCPPECGECSRCGWTSCYDDVGFIERMLDSLQADFSADPERIYVLGVGNGGMMALRLGCNLSARFAAVAAIAAQLAPGYACGPQTDLPMLHLYGGKDNTVRFDGLPSSDGFIYSTAAITAKTWAESLSCRIGPVAWQNEFSRMAGFTCSAYSHCAVAGHETISCMDPDQGHAWPGQQAVNVFASCVTAEQFESLPDQLRCPDKEGEFTHEGMNLVWAFMRQYRIGDN